MSRRTIAVCVTGYNWEYESRVIDGINSRCEELDISLLIFASLIQKPDINSRKTLPESIVRGESEIFNLINYDLVDGVIILGGYIVDERVIYSVSEKCGKHGIPMININDPDHRLKINVDLSDRVAMEYVIRHIVERHGKRRINFIGGFPGNLQTEERLAAYKKVLTEYGIPIEEERIGYGEFWIKAKDCTERFMRSEQRPEAIEYAPTTLWRSSAWITLKKTATKFLMMLLLRALTVSRTVRIMTPRLPRSDPLMLRRAKPRWIFYCAHGATKLFPR